MTHTELFKMDINLDHMHLCSQFISNHLHFSQHGKWWWVIMLMFCIVIVLQVLIRMTREPVSPITFYWENRISDKK